MQVKLKQSRTAVLKRTRLYSLQTKQTRISQIMYSQSHSYNIPYYTIRGSLCLRGLLGTNCKQTACLNKGREGFGRYGHQGRLSAAIGTVCKHYDFSSLLQKYNRKMGATKNQGHLVWTQNEKMPHTGTPKQEPQFWKLPKLLERGSSRTAWELGRYSTKHW